MLGVSLGCSVCRRDLGDGGSGGGVVDEVLSGAGGARRSPTGGCAVGTCGRLGPVGGTVVAAPASVAGRS
jgi:hypothetical protein